MRRLLHGERKKLRRTALWSLRVAVAFPFLVAGSFKLFGAASMVALFDDIGLGQWFRFVTGGLEVGGGILVFSRHCVLGALILACVTAGAIVTHLVVIGGSSVPASILFALTASLAIIGLRRHAGEMGASR